MTAPMTLPTTCHSQPWALIRRNGDTPGKRWSTRMAYLVDTIAPNGQAIALTGYVVQRHDRLDEAPATHRMGGHHPAMVAAIERR